MSSTAVVSSNSRISPAGGNVSHGDATTMSRWANNVDFDLRTRGMCTSFTRSRWHFNRNVRGDSRLDRFAVQRRTAVNLWNRRGFNFRNRAMAEFGRGLHPLQDRRAHQGWSRWIPVTVIPHVSRRQGDWMPGRTGDFDSIHFDLRRRNSLHYISVRTNGNRTLRYWQTGSSTKSAVRSFVNTIRYTRR